ncbi:hypothetical protein KKE60_07555 [Patescibacteria group bacterium]|nr:hypothetical protein [Patescibacteria group bacterium]
MSKWRQWEDLPPEQEEELIDQTARTLIQHRAGLPVQLLLESGGPLTSLFAKFWLGLYGPYLDFIGLDKHMAILRKRSNIEKILDRIDKLQTKKESEEKKTPEGIPQDKTNYLVLSNILITGLVIMDLTHLTGLISLNPGLLTLANSIMLVIAYTAYKLKKRINKRKKVFENRDVEL